MACGGVGGEWGADVGDCAAGLAGRHGRWSTFAAYDIFGVLFFDSEREFVWVDGSPTVFPRGGRWYEVTNNPEVACGYRAIYGAGRYHQGFAFRPARAEDVGLNVDSSFLPRGFPPYVDQLVLIDGQWVAAPPIPGPFRGRTQLQEDVTPVSLPLVGFVERYRAWRFPDQPYVRFLSEEEGTWLIDTATGREIERFRYWNDALADAGFSKRETTRAIDLIMKETGDGHDPSSEERMADALESIAQSLRKLAYPDQWLTEETR